MILNSKNRFSPLDMIFAHSVNDPEERWWPSFPHNQTDTLLENKQKQKFNE